MCFTANVEFYGGLQVYLIFWFQLNPQTELRPWLGDDGEPERYETLEAATDRAWELLHEDDYRGLMFLPRLEGQGLSLALFLRGLSRYREKHLGNSQYREFTPGECRLLCVYAMGLVQPIGRMAYPDNRGLGIFRMRFLVLAMI